MRSLDARDGSSGKKLKGRSRKPTEFPGVVVLGMSSAWGMCRKPTVTQATRSCRREGRAMLRRLRGDGAAGTQAPDIRKGKSGEPGAGSPPSKLVLALLGLCRDPGTQQGSWDWTGILGPGRDPGTGQGSWNWTGILGLDRDLFQGGAGKRQSWYLVFNVLIVAKKLLKDDRWVPGVVLVVDAAAVSL